MSTYTSVKRILRLTGAAVLASGVILAGGGGSAWADTPSQAGWWTATNPGTGFGAPSPPAPPDVPPNGLLVEGGGDSPTAYAAVVYEVPSGSTVGDLILTVASNGGQPDATPATNLQLCPLKSVAISAEHGGPMSDAPSYSTSHCVTSGASSSGGSYTFKVSALVSDGALAVAILPTTPTDRVVFSQPGSNSLAVQSGSSSSPAAVGGSDGSFGSTGSATGSPVGAPSGTSGGSVGSAVFSPRGTPTPPAVSVGAVPAGAADSLAGPSPALTLSGGASVATHGATPAPPAGPPAATSGSPAANSFNPADFAYSSLKPPPAKAWAVGGLVAAVIVGAVLWLIVGRSAGRAAVARQREAA